MSMLPLNMIFYYPINIQLVYFLFSFIIALAGLNRKMGFWGYLFCSIIFSPLIGFIILSVSAKKK